MAVILQGSIEGLVVDLLGKTGKVSRIVNDALYAEAQNVQAEIRKRVPYEYGNLEDAIKIQNLGRRRSWSVYVDEGRPDDTGKYTVGDYAAWLNEGQYMLGPGSIAKEAAVGVEVGPKYMERGLQAVIDSGLMDRMTAAARDALGN